MKKKIKTLVGITSDVLPVIASEITPLPLLPLDGDNEYMILKEAAKEAVKAIAKTPKAVAKTAKAVAETPKAVAKTTKKTAKAVAKTTKKGVKAVAKLFR